MAFPSVVVPSLKMTDPLGTAEPDAGVTVAVNVTDAPKGAGLTEEARVTEVPILPMADGA
jgi:hypothetical protein